MYEDYITNIHKLSKVKMQKIERIHYIAVENIITWRIRLFSFTTTSSFFVLFVSFEWKADDACPVAVFVYLQCECFSPLLHGSTIEGRERYRQYDEIRYICLYIVYHISLTIYIYILFIFKYIIRYCNKYIYD